MRTEKHSTGNLRIGYTRLCNPCLRQPAVSQSLDLQLAHHAISHTVLTIHLALDWMFTLVKFEKLSLQSYFDLDR